MIELKKTIKYLSLFVCLFLLFGCTKSNTGSLTEINVSELITIIDSDKNVIIATIDAKDETIVSNLQKVTSLTHNDIYYVDINVLSEFESNYVSILFDDADINGRIYTIKDNNVDINEEIPTTITEIRNVLNNETYDKYDLTEAIQERKAYYNEGVDAYAEGYLSTAYYDYYSALPDDDAKYALEDNLFNLINRWEYSSQEDNTCTYLWIGIPVGEDSVYQKYYHGSCKKMDIDSLKSTIYDFKIDENNNILTRTDDEEYEIRYSIKALSKESITLNYKNKEYTLVPYEE